MKTQTLGVIGGLGPFTSVYFYELLTKMQQVQKEQDYINLLLYSVPSTPDRTSFIMGGSTQDPGAALIKAAQTLAKAGAEVLVIPCCTAHYFYTRVTEAVSVPVLHIVEETARHLRQKSLRKAGLLATSGTIRGRLFHRIFSEYDMELVLPGDENQQQLMELIYGALKQGKPADTVSFTRLAEDLYRRGAETVILGCTELSLVMRDNILPRERFTDALQVLAQAALTRCGAEIRRI